MKVPKVRDQSFLRFQVLLSAFVACASAIVATPYGLAAPAYGAAYGAAYHAPGKG